MAEIKFILILLLFIETLQKSDVYFTKIVSSQKIIDMFEKLNIELTGNIGLKVHTGEREGPYFLKPSFLKDIYDYTGGTFIECNTAYLSGQRHTTELHEETLEINGWTDYRIILMDKNETNDFNLTIKNHHNISQNIVGENLRDFDSCLVLSHFKGHPMGGFGGALKQLSIGFASRAGKANIHSAGYTTDYKDTWFHTANQIDFTSSMADAASSIVDYFKSKGNIAYINVLANISTMCDCGGKWAPAPKIRDIGILASLDPVAIDQACYDLIVNENTTGSEEWIAQSDRLIGLNTIKASEELGIGTRDYNLIDVDDEQSSDTDTPEPITDTTEPEPSSDTDTPEPITDTTEPEPSSDTDTPEPITDTTKPEPISDTTEPETDTPCPRTDTTEPGSDSTQPGTDTTNPESDTPSGDDNSLVLYIAISVGSILVIVLLILVVIRLKCKTRKGSLIDDELGETIQD